MVSAWGMTPETAGDGNEALLKLNNFAADVILTDLNMPGMDGFAFLQRLRDSGEMPPTIVLTAFGNVETAVQTVHELGAYWYMEKPIQPATLDVLIRRAGTHAGLRAEKRNLERQLSYKGSLGELVGTSPKIQEIFALLQQAGPSKACVLITGESGTGRHPPPPPPPGRVPVQPPPGAAARGDQQKDPASGEKEEGPPPRSAG